MITCMRLSRLSCSWRFVKGLVLLAVVHSAPLCGAQSPVGPTPKHFPEGAIDYFGYFSWNYAGPLSTASLRAKMLMESRRAEEGYLLLLRSYRKTPSDLRTFAVLASAARASRRQLALLEEVVSLAYDLVSKNGQDMSHAPEYLRVAYQYAKAMLSEERNAARYNGPDIVDSLSAKAQIAESFLRFGQEKPRKLEFEGSIMRISALVAFGETAVSRRELAALLEVHPESAELKSMLARLFTTGSMIRKVGNGPWKNSPAEEQPNPKKAFELAESVVKSNPDYIPAYYVAGMTTTDQQKARRYLRLYLEKGKPDAYERFRIKMKLQELDRKPVKSG